MTFLYKYFPIIGLLLGSNLAMAAGTIYELEQYAGQNHGKIIRLEPSGIVLQEVWSINRGEWARITFKLPIASTSHPEIKFCTWSKAYTQKMVIGNKRKDY